ncbi:MAG: dihydrolipoamide acetyltransferase family protein [bacterium]
MALEFKLPDIGEGIAEGEVVNWLVEEGEVVAEDQPMVEVMTDKATVEITTPRKGQILEILVEEGTVVEIGTGLVIIGEEGEEVPESEEELEVVEAEAELKDEEEATRPAPDKVEEREGEQEEEGGETGPGAAAGPRPGGKQLAATSVRRIAREKDVDIDQVPGSGPAGRVMAEDVASFTKGAEPSDAPAREKRKYPSGGEERFKLKGLRRKISERLTESQQKAVHVTHVDEIDATRLVALRQAAKERAPEGVKVTYLPFIIKALIAALREYPMFNAYLDEEAGEIAYLYDYHVGVAVATDRGLLVPVIRDADRKSAVELAREMVDKAEATRDASIGPDDLRGSTITITNYGAIGGLFATPVINYPEAAILGVGGIKERPVAVDGEVEIRPMMYLGITFDHRITDGAEGAAFMNTLKSYLEEPGLILLEI